ncbi:hypothetical protein [Tenacibaculum sp. nBUS_03]|uniref:hypothetical protein n=1 Tax=Tenacibaculum sp. nBUS_03 TaxID=3395320 RepID=UPI003EBEF286
MNKKVIARPRGIIIFILFFCLVLILGLSIVFYTKPDSRLFLLLFISFIMYGVYHIAKTFTYLKIERDFITCGLNSKYNYNEIKKVTLYDIKDYKFLFFPMREECLTIIFEDGKEVILEDNFYKNLWKIRWSIENKVIKNDHSFNFDFNLDFDCGIITNKTSPISFFIKLTPFLFFFFLISFITNIILTFLDIYSNGLLIIISFLGLMNLIIFHGKSYYMESCDKGIYIKNLIFKHVNIKISLNKIESIRLETTGGGRNKTTFLVIHMKYHRDYKFVIDYINHNRTKNIINQVKKLDIDFYDLRY